MKTTLEFEHGEETQAKIAQGSYDAYCSLALLLDRIEISSSQPNYYERVDIVDDLTLILDQWYTTEDLDG